MLTDTRRIIAGAFSIEFSLIKKLKQVEDISSSQNRVVSGHCVRRIEHHLVKLAGCGTSAAETGTVYLSAPQSRF